MSFHDALLRLAAVLEAAPASADGRTLVPLGALLDVIEHCAALLRTAGHPFEADRLDAIRRGYLQRTTSRVIQPAAAQAKPPKPPRPVPGRR